MKKSSLATFKLKSYAVIDHSAGGLCCNVKYR